MVLKSVRSNSGKSDGRNPRNSGTGETRLSLGPEMPAPTKWEAGMPSSLVSTWGLGRQNGGAEPKFLI